MTLALDTTTLRVVRLRIDDARSVRRFTFRSFADAALPTVMRKLRGKKPTALGVVVGPGAFSATRTGVALMNALAYAWAIPLTALTTDQFDAATPLPRGVKKPVAVVYGAEPNITLKKK